MTEIPGIVHRLVCSPASDTWYGISCTEENRNAIIERLQEENRQYGDIQVTVDAQQNITFKCLPSGRQYTLTLGDMLFWYEHAVTGRAVYMSLPFQFVAIHFLTDFSLPYTDTCISAFRKVILASYPEYDVFVAQDDTRLLEAIAPWYDHETNVQHIYLDDADHIDITDLHVLVCCLPAYSTRYDCEMQYHFHFKGVCDTTVIYGEHTAICTMYRHLNMLPPYRKQMVADITWDNENDTESKLWGMYRTALWDTFVNTR